MKTTMDRHRSTPIDRATPAHSSCWHHCRTLSTPSVLSRIYSYPVRKLWLGNIFLRFLINRFIPGKYYLERDIFRIHFYSYQVAHKFLLFCLLLQEEEYYFLSFDNCIIFELS